MADIHVRTRDGNVYELVLHYPVPASNNSAGIAWSAALVNSGTGGKTVLPDGDGTGGTISTAEKTQIIAGTVFEDSVRWSPPLNFTSTAEVNAALDAFYTIKKAERLGQLQAIFGQFGRTRVVP